MPGGIQAVGSGAAAGATAGTEGSGAAAGHGFGFMIRKSASTRLPDSVCVSCRTGRKPGALASTSYVPGGISAKIVSPSDPEGVPAASWPSREITRTFATPIKAESSSSRRHTLKAASPA